MSNHVGHFSLWGDFELDEITSALGLQPSEVGRKGDVLEGADFPARVATWDLYCPSDTTLNEQVDFLLNLLWPRAEVLRPLAERFNAEMNVVGICGEGAHVLKLNVETLHRLVSLKVTLNCFCLEDEV